MSMSICQHVRIQLFSLGIKMKVVQNVIMMSDSQYVNVNMSMSICQCQYVNVNMSIVMTRFQILRLSLTFRIKLLDV